MLDIAGQVMSLMDPNFNKPSGPVSTKIQNRTTPRVLQVILPDVRQPRVLKTTPLSTKDVTNRMVEMVKSGRIMKEPIYVNNVNSDPPKKRRKI